MANERAATGPTLEQQQQVLAEIITEETPNLGDRANEIAAVMTNSALSREEQMKKLQEMGVNGDSQTIEALTGNVVRQVDIQKKVERTWLGWGYDMVTAPFKFAYNHPILTAVIVAGVAVGGWYLWQHWHQIASLLHEAAGTVAEGTRNSIDAANVIPGGTPLPEAAAEVVGGGGSFAAPTGAIDPSIGLRPMDFVVPNYPGAAPVVPTP